MSAISDFEIHWDGLIKPPDSFAIKTHPVLVREYAYFFMWACVCVTMRVFTKLHADRFLLMEPQLSEHLIHMVCKLEKF